MDTMHAPVPVTDNDPPAVNLLHAAPHMAGDSNVMVPPSQYTPAVRSACLEPQTQPPYLATNSRFAMAARPQPPNQPRSRATRSPEESPEVLAQSPALFEPQNEPPFIPGYSLSVWEKLDREAKFDYQAHLRSWQDRTREMEIPNPGPLKIERGESSGVGAVSSAFDCEVFRELQRELSSDGSAPQSVPMEDSVAVTQKPNSQKPNTQNLTTQEATTNEPRPVMVTHRGRQVDISHLHLDPEFLDALPCDIREEIIQIAFNDQCMVNDQGSDVVDLGLDPVMVTYRGRKFDISFMVMTVEEFESLSDGEKDDIVGAA